MIEGVITEINTRIGTLNAFSKMFGLCDKITKDGTSFPAEYCEKEYKSVSDFDKENGTIYHRLTGDISITEADEESAVSCDPFVELTYPMRVVAVVRKAIFTAYSDKLTANFIGSKIAFNNSKALSLALGVDVTGVQLKSISTDRDKIFKEEYEGIENKIPFEYSYIAIDYEIKMSGNVSCFPITEDCTIVSAGIPFMIIGDTFTII